MASTSHPTSSDNGSGRPTSPPADGMPQTRGEEAPDTPPMRRNLSSNSLNKILDDDGDNGQANEAVPALPAAPLLNLFQPPPNPRTPPTHSSHHDDDDDGLFVRSATERRGNQSNSIASANINAQPPPTLAQQPQPRPTTTSSQSHMSSNANSANSAQQQSLLLNLFQPPPSPTKKSSDEYSALLGNSASSFPASPYVDPEHVFLNYKHKSSGTPPQTATKTTLRQQVIHFAQTHLTPATLAGAFMFLLYHVVFCMAVASAIVRPHGTQPILGVMVQLVSLGILFAGPLYILRLGSDVPAVYPSVDCFLAPFLARAAVQLDQVLYETRQANTSNNTNNNNIHDDDDDDNDETIFLASFAVLTAIGMGLAASLLVLASRFKLANLGSFLPYPVLCGFFSAVGVLLWALGFQIDNGGQTWQSVVFSGDLHQLTRGFLHHGPSIVVGLLMNILGPRHPGYVPLLIVTTIAVFYAVLFLTGTRLEQAQQEGWFWSKNDLQYQRPANAPVWAPPMPLGQWMSIISGTVDWHAVGQGVSEMALLAFLYLLRSSIHASALKKNVANLVQKVPIPTTNDNHQSPGHRKRPSVAESLSTRMHLVSETLDNTTAPRMPSRSGMSHKRLISDSIDMEAVHDMLTTTRTSGGKARTSDTEAGGSGGDDSKGYYEIRPKTPRRTLEDIFTEYGYTLYAVALTGGFGVCPTVATSNTMYAIGAGGPAPQYGSILLLVLFYFTDFDMVRFIPKTVFSSLLVLGAFDTFVVWFFMAFQKTQDVLEWLVVPLIVLFSLLVGFLNAVFLGIGISMFVFVSSFFRVGVVKYSASGLELRSTIERPVKQADYLDSHGDLIQILVLQNYLFFGNATSILAYCSTMFEDVNEEEACELNYEIPPKPKILVLDMSLVTGMDTSGFDIFADLRATCTNHQCKIFFCGLSPRLRKGLALSGVKPETGAQEKRTVRFFSDCDAALGKAEDLIAKDFDDNANGSAGRIAFSFYHMTKKTQPLSGFQIALKEIDEQHGQQFAEDLGELEPYVTPLSLDAGDKLYESDGGLVEDDNRGLFFIESGMLNIQRDTGDTLGQGRSTITRSRNALTFNHRHARLGTVGRNAAAIKATTRVVDSQNFRLARFGPGWIVGDIEFTSGLRNRGVHVAVSPCRLHHLSPTKIDRLEKENPLLVLRLYKMLSYLMAHRQETTIGQVATLKTIMSSPAHSKPVSRAARQALAYMR